MYPLQAGKGRKGQDIMSCLQNAEQRIQKEV